MKMDDAVQIIKPAPDSHYRLVPCKCGSDNVAYVLGNDGRWRVQCFDCGHIMELQAEAEKAGFQFVNLLAWRKQNKTPNRYYMKQLEFILLLRKGRARSINNMGTGNCLDVPNIIGKKTHPTEKPVELMQILVENSSQPGETVLDPFMGTGSTGVACVNTGRGFIGMELDQGYFEIARRRIDNGLQIQT
jgi:site-specific DNA-methyltransferase (adenine-specific)